MQSELAEMNITNKWVTLVGSSDWLVGGSWLNLYIPTWDLSNNRLVVMMMLHS